MSLRSLTLKEEAIVKRLEEIDKLIRLDTCVLCEEFEGCEDCPANAAKYSCSDFCNDIKKILTKLKDELERTRREITRQVAECTNKFFE